MSLESQITLKVYLWAWEAVQRVLRKQIPNGIRLRWPGATILQNRSPFAKVSFPRMHSRGFPYYLKAEPSYETFLKPKWRKAKKQLSLIDT